MHFVGSYCTDYKWSSGVSIDKRNYSDDNKPTSRVLKVTCKTNLLVTFSWKKCYLKIGAASNSSWGPATVRGVPSPTGKVKLLLLFRVLSEDDATVLVTAVNTRKFHTCAAFRCSPLSGGRPGMVIIYCHFNDQLSARSLGQPYLQECFQVGSGNWSRN